MATLDEEWSSQMLDPAGLAEARKYYKDDEISAYLQKRLKPGVKTQVLDPTAQPGFIEPGGRMVPPAARSQESGATFGERVMASFKSRPEDRLGYYKSIRGPENVTLSPGGEILLRHNGQWRNVDEPGLSMGDIADFAGDSPEMLGTLLGSWRGKIGQAVVGAMSGDLVKQAIAALGPGSEKPRGVLDRVGELGKAGIGGGVAQGIGFPTNLSPTRFIAEQLNKRLEKLGTSELAQEGRALNMRIDPRNPDQKQLQAQMASEMAQGRVFPLNVAEETADPWAKMILGFAYRNAYGQELAALDKRAKDMAALAMFKRLSGQLGKAGAYSGDFGQAAARAGQASVRDIEDSLAKVGREDFGFLQTPMGSMNTINTARYRNLLDERARYYESMGEMGLPMAKELRGMIPKEASLNPRAVEELMQQYYDKSFGKEGAELYRNLKGASGRKLPRELYDALKADLEEGAKQQGPLGEGARALMGARGKREELLKLRDRLGEIPLLKFMESKGMLTKALGNEGMVGSEQIGAHLLDLMRNGKTTPSEISNMVKMLEPVNPDFVKDLHKYIIDQAIREGSMAGKKGINPAGFDYMAGYKALPPADYLQALYGDVWNPGTKTLGGTVNTDLLKLMRAIQRAETVGQGIPHSPGQTVVSILGHLMGGNFGAAGKQALSQIAFPKTVANFALNPTARGELASTLKGFTEKQGDPYLRGYAEKVLPMLLYELGSSAQRQNRPEVGE